ncbi:hypothetical protein J4E93_003902 [Alternaria ventricosa]|uniref:uncharacterized protein n=1 Tax=Alternaria ventricosa TaxID=1187951 RepID=UPI0020C41623|nr:uncharacterized protein J4E93_003902 [Alternaria ventricosa]KAI4649582.1 hypothetical protein J4E93_003902 [Alternaria ventricosa]
MFANIPTTLFLLVTSLTLPTYAGIQQTDFSGIGHIYVLASDNWGTATPESSVGCLNAHGKFVHDSGSGKECGTFQRMDDYPYTLSTHNGNCTFQDASQEENVDSHYGQGDYAWTCTERNVDIYDELYTITGFPYVFLCFGDVACYYDAKRAPTVNESLPLWQFRWGSQQTGITPGHIMLQLMWKKLGDTPKREQMSEIPGPRIQLSEGMQISLLGQKSKA